MRETGADITRLRSKVLANSFEKIKTINGKWVEIQCARLLLGSFTRPLRRGFRVEIDERKNVLMFCKEATESCICFALFWAWAVLRDTLKAWADCITRSKVETTTTTMIKETAIASYAFTSFLFGKVPPPPWTVLWKMMLNYSRYNIWIRWCVEPRI